jgi:Tfp pilus assembly protein PilO
MPKEQAERLWLGIGVGAGLLMLLIGYFFFIGPQRSQTSDTNAQVATAQLTNQTLQTRITSLQQQDKDLAKYQAAVAQARLALPGTSGLPDFLRTLQALGNATLANVTSLAVGAPTTLTPTTATPATTASTTGKAGSSTTATPATAAVYALPITATVTGTPAQLQQFLTQLQSVQPRAVLITQITQSAGTAGTAGGATSGTSLQLTMSAFVEPSSASEQAALSAAAAH